MCPSEKLPPICHVHAKKAALALLRNFANHSGNGRTIQNGLFPFDANQNQCLLRFEALILLAVAAILYSRFNTLNVDQWWIEEAPRATKVRIISCVGGGREFGTGADRCASHVEFDRIRLCSIPSGFVGFGG